MTRKAERAIRSSVSEGERLATPTGRGVFEVAEIRRDAIVLLFGEKRARTRLPWDVLDDALDALAGREWVVVGAVHAVSSPRDSLEAVLKPSIRRSSANYVAALFEKAGLVDLDYRRPMRVRLRH